MEVVVGANILIHQPTPLVSAWVRRAYEYPNPAYWKAKRLNKWTGGMSETIRLYSEDAESMLVPFGCLQPLWAIMPKGTPFRTTFPPFQALSMEGDINLYPYQQRALQALLKGKNGVLQAPCGSGKTQIGLALIKAIGGKALWLTHTQKLLRQSMERARQYFKGDFGTITKGKVRIGRDITFATVQTMSKVDSNVYKNAFSCVVVDECHHCCGTPAQVSMFYKVIGSCNCRHKYGLSATLERADGLLPSMFALIGPLLHTISKEEVGDKITKAELKPLEFTGEYEEGEYLSYDGTLDYAKMLRAIEGNAQRNALICDLARMWVREKHRVLILTAGVEHARALDHNLGVLSSCVVGSVPEKVRNYDAPAIVATYALAKEGLDIPELDRLIFATPTKDPVTVKQSVGRIERACEGKGVPIAVYVVDGNIPYCSNAWKKAKRILG